MQGYLVWPQSGGQQSRPQEAATLQDCFFTLYLGAKLLLLRKTEVNSGLCYTSSAEGNKHWINLHTIEQDLTVSRGSKHTDQHSCPMKWVRYHSRETDQPKRENRQFLTVDVKKFQNLHISEPNTQLVLHAHKIDYLKIFSFDHVYMCVLCVDMYVPMLMEAS